MLTTIILLKATLITSFISGVMGMGGGIVLMAVLMLLLPVKEAIILHGFIQFFANFSRMITHRKNIIFSIIPTYFLGCSAAFSLLTISSFIPEKSWSLIFLGLICLTATIKVEKFTPSILKKGSSLLCGMIVTTAQIFAGASGPLLDLFFINSGLNRFEIVATKAATQSIGHLIKIIFYLNIDSFSDLSIGPTVLVATLVCSYIGTVTGKNYLNKMTDQSFKDFSKKLLFIISVVLIVKGLLVLV